MNRLPQALLLAFLAALAWSGFHPKDRLIWLLEVLPAVVGAALLAATYRRFRFTDPVCVLMAVHALILVVGGRYTYAEVPAGNWVRDLLGLARNPYDRLGHLAQGFVPALVARELLLRLTPLRPGGWLNTLVVSVCLAISAVYELLEWAAVTVSGSAADAFMGTQGDPWDAQWDMACALLGSVLALALLSRLHDRALSGLRAAGLA